MWFPERVKYVCNANIEKALNRLRNIDEAAWDANAAVKQQLAGDRPTQSLFLYSIDQTTFNDILTNRPLMQADVSKLAAYDLLYDDLRDLFELVLEYYPKGGIFTRVQLARMRPGSRITPHRDVMPILENCHRLHIPLITNEKLKFMVDGERVKLEAGKLYELNNQVNHSVDNPKDAADRVHMIFDYLPPEHNVPQSLDPNFKFQIRKDRARKKLREPNDDIAMPTVIATSVVRGAHQNESHGGVYLVNMGSGSVDQMVDWNTCNIDFSGRGWDRGLRGICFYEQAVIIAASDELFFYDRHFNVTASYKNTYLRHAHEIMIDGRFMYVTSTGFDSILRFNLRKKIFDRGWQLYIDQNNHVSVRVFDPSKVNQVKESNLFHINSVDFYKGRLYVSGRQMVELMMISDDKIIHAAQIPRGTHNVSFYSKGIIYNNTDSDQIVYSSNYDYRAVDVAGYDASKLLNNELGDEKLARPGFGRGLCKYREGTFLAGSSPSTVSLIDMRSKSIIKSVNISMDVRNAIHGLEIWPY